MILMLLSTIMHAAVFANLLCITNRLVYSKFKKLILEGTISLIINQLVIAISTWLAYIIYA